MYVVHWNIFMVNKRDLQQNKKIKQKKLTLNLYNKFLAFNYSMLPT